MKVRVFGTLRSAVGDRKEIRVCLDERSTLLKVLDRLITAYPSLQEKVFGDGEELQGGVNIFVNGRSVRFLAGCQWPLCQVLGWPEHRLGGG